MDVLEAIHNLRGQPPLPRPGSDRTPVVVARLLTEPDADYLATISIAGSEPLVVPAAAGVYTGVTTVYAMMDRGRPVMVQGPAGAPVYTSPDPVVEETVSVVRGRVITPTVSGTWRAGWSAWDRWNDPTDVYQAGSTASGALSGIACYGTQITALGATDITRAVLTIVSNGHPNAGAWTASIKGAAHASLPAGAPTLAATSTSVSVPSADGGVVSVELDATTRGNLRTGTWFALGLAASGTYGGTRGTRDGRGWVLSLDYTVTA